MTEPTPAAPDHPGVIAPPPLLYAGALAIGFIGHWLYPVHVLPRAVARAAALVALTSGSALLVAAVLAFRRARTSPHPYRPTTAVIANGLFRLTRNPIYCGFTLLYAAAALWANALWPLVLLVPLMVAVQRGVVLPEERYLERKFGDEYRRYKAGVRRWV